MAEITRANLILADYAQAADGKLTLVGGGFNTMLVPDVPSQLPPFFAALSLTVKPSPVLHLITGGPAGQAFEVEMGVNDTTLGKLEVRLRPQQGPNAQEVLNLAVPLNGLTAEQPGLLSIWFAVGGERIATADLFVRVRSQVPVNGISPN